MSLIPNNLFGPTQQRLQALFSRRMGFIQELSFRHLPPQQLLLSAVQGLLLHLGPGQVEENPICTRAERNNGKFMRRFRLPKNAKVEQVKVAMENGVLAVTVPKAEENKKNFKSVEISG